MQMVFNEPAQLMEEAAHWYARLSSDQCTQEDEAAFESWSARSPANAEAYSEICALSARFEVSFGDLQREAFLAHDYCETEQNAVGRGSRRSNHIFKPLAALTSIAAAIAVIMMLPHSDQTSSPGAPKSVALAPSTLLETAKGELRDVRLADGSKVILGSGSRLHVQFSDQRREFRLDRGLAFFDVAHDKERPFVVSAEGRSVTAHGTSFDIQIVGQGVSVTLLRGRVSVAARDKEAVFLAPGQQLQASSERVIIRTVDAEAEMAWRTGLLDFDNISLATAVARFNANSTKTMVIEDPQLADLRVSGVFRAQDPVGFAMALAPAYRVAADISPQGIIRLRSRDK